MADLPNRTSRAKSKWHLGIGPEGFVAFSLICIFWLVQISPRNLLSPLNVPSFFPPQYWLLIFSVLFLTLILLIGRKKLKGALAVEPLVPVVLGFAGFVFTFVRSLSESGLSRPTLDLMSGLMIIPVAFVAGVFVRKLDSWFWLTFLGSFLPLLAFALVQGPNSAAKYTVYSVNSIEFGLLMATASIIAFMLASDKGRPMLLIASGLFATGLLLSGSRGATLAWILSLATAIIMGNRSGTVALGRLVNAAGVGIFALGLTFVVQTLRPIDDSGAGPGPFVFGSSGRSKRIEIWTGVIREILEGRNLFIGLGIVDGFVPLGRSHPHNIILLYSLVGGIFAVMAILYFVLGGALRLAANSQPGNSPVLAALVVLWFTHLQFAGNFGEGLNLFLLTGVVWGLDASRRGRRVPSSHARGAIAFEESHAPKPQPKNTDEKNRH